MSFRDTNLARLANYEQKKKKERIIMYENYINQTHTHVLLIDFNSSTKPGPALVTMRFDTGLFSFRLSFVEFAMTSTLSNEMSPSHKMKRALISSR
jgi:hypothetical protein